MRVLGEGKLQVEIQSSIQGNVSPGRLTNYSGFAKAFILPTYLHHVGGAVAASTHLTRVFHSDYSCRVLYRTAEA